MLGGRTVRFAILPLEVPFRNVNWADSDQEVAPFLDEVLVDLFACD